MVFAVFVIAFGAALCVPFGSSSVTSYGMLLVIISTTMSGLRPVISALLMSNARDSGLSPIPLLWYDSLISVFVLLVVFAMFCYHNVPGYLTSMNENPVAKASIVFIGVVFTFLLILVHIAGIRWIKEGRFDFLLDDDTADGVSAGSVSTSASGKGENA